MYRLVHVLVVLALLLAYVGGPPTPLFAQPASDQPQTDGAVVPAQNDAIQATSILVTTNKDEWDTPALPGKVSPTKCSLREALQIIAAPGSGDRGCKNLTEAASYTIDFAGGVNVTLGLKIVRTSPDHGTAFDIAGKGIADPSSLIAALHLAGEIAERRATGRP